MILLENLRFDPGEEANDIAFAGLLAEHADAYVDDAFGAVHRAHASVVALPELMLASGRSAVAGRLVAREVEVLGTLLHDPAQPFVAILGGAKVSDKLGVIASLAERVDALVIGGAMAFTLIAAEGGKVGASLVEEDKLDEVRDALAAARSRGVPVHLPVDVVAAPAIDADGAHRDRAGRRCARGVDGPRHRSGDGRGLHRGARRRRLDPVERPDGGVRARAVRRRHPGGRRARAPTSDGFTVVGGGDSLAAIRREGLADAFDHLSTGGGASLEFLEGRPLPGLAILEDDA